MAIKQLVSEAVKNMAGKRFSVEMIVKRAGTKYKTTWAYINKMRKAGEVRLVHIGPTSKGNPKGQNVYQEARYVKNSLLVGTKPVSAEQFPELKSEPEDRKYVNAMIDVVNIARHEVKRMKQSFVEMIDENEKLKTDLRICEAKIECMKKRAKGESINSLLDIIDETRKEILNEA